MALLHFARSTLDTVIRVVAILLTLLLPTHLQEGSFGGLGPFRVSGLRAV